MIDYDSICFISFIPLYDCYIYFPKRYKELCLTTKECVIRRIDSGNAVLYELNQTAPTKFNSKLKKRETPWEKERKNLKHASYKILKSETEKRS